MAFTWTARTSSFGATDINGVAYNGSNLFVAVGNAGKLATSPDGITWTQRTSTFGASDIYGVAYGGGTWVIVGAAKVATSPDGITWTLRSNHPLTSGFPGGGRPLNYINSLFVMAGFVFDATGDKGLATSADGITWVLKAFDSGDSGYAFSPIYHGGLYVVGASGSQIFTSPDLTTWTQRTDGSSPFGSGADLTGLARLSTGVWLTGFYGELANSTDGLTWTLGTIDDPLSGDYDNFNDFLYAGGQYLTAGWGSQPLTSGDGIDWTVDPAFPTITACYSLAASADIIVAVGSSGKLDTGSLDPPPEEAFWTGFVACEEILA